MKILLVGEYYSVNLGDPLLCRTVRKTIEEACPDAQIVPFDLSGKISYEEDFQLEHFSLGTRLYRKLSARFPRVFARSAFHRAFKRSEWRYLRTWCHLEQVTKEHTFDLVIFAGGSLFMDYFAGIIYMIVKRFACTKTKILFHACGMSRLDPDSEGLLRAALASRNVISVSLRDSVGRFRETFPIRAKVTETYDTALICSRYFPAADGPTVTYGIGVIAQERFFEQQKALIAWFLDSGHSWRVFTNGSPEDETYAVKLLQELGVPEERMHGLLEARPRTAAELVKTVTKFRYLISFRMHSQITAASFGIPSYGFAWDAKIPEFYTKLGLPGNCSDGAIDREEILRALSCDRDLLQKTAWEQGKQSQQALIEAIGMLDKGKKVMK